MLQVASLHIEPLGLPWDWLLEPQVYPKSLTYSASLSSSQLLGCSKTAVRCAASFLCTQHGAGASRSILRSQNQHAEASVAYRHNDALSRWRAEDLIQQHLDNALVLWTRFERALRTEMVIFLPVHGNVSCFPMQTQRPICESQCLKVR